MYKGCNLQGQLAVAATVAHWSCRMLGPNAHGMNKTYATVSINQTSTPRREARNLPLLANRRSPQLIQWLSVTSVPMTGSYAYLSEGQQQVATDQVS